MTDKHKNLKAKQALPLEEKIIYSRARIVEWLDEFPDATVAFSGGLDSTVMLDVIRGVAPETKGIFINTGIEFPEIVSFVKQTANVEIVRPEISFLKVIREKGYPVVSKRMAQYIKEVQRSKSETATKHLRLTGYRGNGTYSQSGKISNKWQFLCTSDIKVSDLCCKFLKKNPARKQITPMIGVKAADSEQRTQTYYMHGCNQPNAKQPHSNPLAIWTDADIRGYIETRNLPYSKIYNMGYKRTGCVFCMFGLHLEKRPDRFDLLKETHPKLFRYCMDGPLQLREVIKIVYNRTYEAMPTQLTLGI